MNENFKRAGVLLKLSLVIEMAATMFVHKTVFVGASVVPAIVIAGIFYLLAHMVQEGKRWTKYPLVFFTVTSISYTAYRLFALYDSPIEYGVLFAVNAAAAIIPLSLVVWATVLVFKEKKEPVSESADSNP